MIFVQLSQQLFALRNLLETLTPDQYRKKIEHLSGASIGAHTRHIIELLQCARNGYVAGQVDYIHRERNLLMESEKEYAINSISYLLDSIAVPDKRLTLVTEQHSDYAENVVVQTTYFREIIYNTEHTIHHLALIKVALVEMKQDIVDQNFGKAYSTINYLASREI
jgi:hypothetical protein